MPVPIDGRMDKGKRRGGTVPDGVSSIPIEEKGRRTKLDEYEFDAQRHRVQGELGNMVLLSFVGSTGACDAL